MDPQPPRRKRCERWDYLWDAHHLTFSCFHYIHDNPIRRKLVARPQDWLWSSARAWATGVDEPLRIDRESLAVLELTKPWEY